MIAVKRGALAGSAIAVAPTLLGAVLRSTIGGGDVAIRLTEVEAYEGTADPASHAYRGPSRRNDVMFGPAGHLYVYFTYGMHWCANVVCGGVGTASAVLLRAGEVVDGTDVARSRRPSARDSRDLARGPARLARCLGLDGSANGTDVCRAGSSVALLRGTAPASSQLRSGPRVGISTAADRPWRFWIADEPTVSVFRRGGRGSRTVARQTGPS